MLWMLLEDELHHSVSQSIIERASVVGREWAKGGLDNVTEVLGLQIAFAVEEIDRMKELDVRLRRELLQLECRSGTDILQLEPKYHHAVDTYRQERNSLKIEVARLEQERVHLTLSAEDKLRAVCRQLLALLSKFHLLRVQK